MCHGHSKMECPGLDPAIIFMVDAERLHTCMQYLSGHPSGTITITPTLQIGKQMILYLRLTIVCLDSHCYIFF